MNLLITGAWQDARAQIPALEKMGHSVKFLQYEKDALPCGYDWAEGIVCNGLFLHHPIEKFENLTYIQLTSAGFDRVPMDYVREKGIEIHNARGVYSVPMAEFALAGVLQALQADVLICGGIGGGAQTALAAAGVKLYGGVSGDADAAVEAFLAGELSYNPNVKCNHHGEHHHGEGHTCGSHGCGSHSCH